MSLTKEQESREIAAHHAKVIQAFADGIPTQVRTEGSDEKWRTLDHTNVNLYKYEIRIKPNELWVNFYPDLGKRIYHPTEDRANMSIDDTTTHIREHYVQVIDVKNINK